ncbi:MAG: glycosyltransferase family 39 protein [Nanoarchaeota archaeon]|nr:glycosyltransferase family 39 protein [Nanoarchaeota archaeon]
MKIKKTLLILFVVVILAFILRLIVAQAVEIVPDEIVYSLLPWKIISAQRLSTVEGGPLFSYLTDLGYILFGEVNAISTRFPSIIFGSLTVILIYLCSLKLFENRKAALFSSFLFALSGYVLENNTESDMVAFFFALLSMYFFLFFLDGKRNYLYLSTACLTLAVLCKILPLLFVPVYALVFFLHTKGYLKSGQDYKEEQDKSLFDKNIFDIKLLKMILGCLAIVFLLLMPTIMYNYLEFKNNGKTENTVSTLLGIGAQFHPETSQVDPWNFSTMLGFLKRFFAKFFIPDPIIVTLGIIGVFLVIPQRRSGPFLLLLSALLLLFYVGGITGSATHYLWVPLVLSLFAGYSIEKGRIFITRFNLRSALVIFIIIFMIMAISSIYFQSIISKKTASMELRKYVVENIPKNAIIIMDPRIYYGSYSWILHERHYLNGMHFQALLNEIGTSASPKVEVPLYYIECSGDTTCGWKREDYDRVNSFAEGLSDYLKQHLRYVGEVDANHHFFVHQGTIAVPPAIFQSIDLTHVFWGSSIGWKYSDLNIDEYPKQGSNKIFHMIGLLFLYLDLLLALLTIPFVFVLLFKIEK